MALGAGRRSQSVDEEHAHAWGGSENSLWPISQRAEGEPWRGR
jgi:hypothetical protein